MLYLKWRFFEVKILQGNAIFLSSDSQKTLPQVFSCGFIEISQNIFSYRTPPVAASDLSFLLITTRGKSTKTKPCKIISYKKAILEQIAEEVCFEILTME